MRNRKNIIIAIMIVVVLLMITGYAAFRTQLNINATGNITTEWNVYFESISPGTPTGSSVNNFAPSVTGTTAVMSADFSLPGDAMTYDIKLVNKGTIDAVIEDIEAVSEGSDVIIFDISGIKKGDKLKAKSEITFQVTIKFDDVTSYPGEVSTDLTVNIKTVQDTGQDVTEEDIFIEGQDENLLVTQILGRNKSNVVSSGDGLYVSTATNDGRPTYYYKGNVTNNYVKFGSQSIEGHCKVKDEYASLYGSVDLSNCSEEYISQEYIESGNGLRGVVCDSNGSYFYDTAMGCGQGGHTIIDGVLEWSEEEPLVWRIVRINEDGTIKLIMQDGLGNNILTAFGETSWEATDYENMYYSINPSASAYSGSDYYHSTSHMKTIVDTWYKDNLKTNYDGIIATYNFCEAAKVGSGTVGNVTFTETSSYTPDFKCQKDANNMQYVSGKAGLITVDELLFAGYSFESANANVYLNNGSNYDYWTMSPAGFMDSEDIDVWRVSSAGMLTVPWRMEYADALARPVINLNSNAKISTSTTGTGEPGTITNPYIIDTN